jgi:aspartokinase/homoserine dehydrogenase 1
MSEKGWRVHKFGGTSVANAERYRNAAKIIAAQSPERAGVVVSAMAGVTNALINLVELAAARDASYVNELRALRRKELEAVGELVGEEGSELVGRIEADFDDIEDILRALWLLRTSPGHAVDLISGYGELWSAQVLAAYLESIDVNATWLDARTVLHVTPPEAGTNRSPYVNWEASREAMQAWLTDNDHDVVVITGFIASDPEGIPTTLGRNGSDYSASIFGALLQADRINIWTDVDGVMSANPKLVPDAVVLDALSYHEAMELAYFGAKVIHPSTMAPAVDRSIPIYIKNTFRPDVPGTRIHVDTSSRYPVKGFATVDSIALVNVEGTSMIGVPGIAHRLFGALREAGVSVIMISQGSSEHSICFAIPAPQAEAAQNAVEQAFFAERHHGQIQTIDVQNDCTILAAVGDEMEGIPGLAARFFGALGKAGVNVRAIAQGSSERNISVVVASRDAERALRAVHSGFYLSDQTISIGLLGPGVVGSTFLDQVHEQLERLRTERKVDLRVRAIATRSKMLLDERAIDLSTWRDRLGDAGQAHDLDMFVDHVMTDALPHAVIIDCTSSAEVAARYGDWLARGIHIVTPNKKAASGEFDAFRELRDITRRSHAHFLYETNVGAGLPILQTARDLVETGDDVHRVEGIFSGTLSYLFNVWDGSTPFSDVVKDAKKKGYTEPDPRDDLSGMDVARKLVILAREVGLELSLDDVTVESLVPESLESGSIEEFLAGLGEIDDAIAKRLERAASQGDVLRYVGSVNASGEATVALERYPKTHPFARIQLTDNIVQFTTRRYSQNPLVVQGPGAGPEVTAGGVFADLLRLASYLGATA